jgi:DNA-binding MarR family transcriptional regulator
MKKEYFDLIMLFERLHRLFLDVVKDTLDRLGIQDLSNTQAVVLYNIGNDQLTVGEISNRGYYLGSNVSYNLRKMINAGYVEQKHSSADRRSTYVFLTSRGKEVLNNLEGTLEKHLDSLPYNNLRVKDLENILTQGRRLESFWNHVLLHDFHR